VFSRDEAVVGLYGFAVRPVETIVRRVESVVRCVDIVVPSVDTVVRPADTSVRCVDIVVPSVDAIVGPDETIVSFNRMVRRRTVMNVRSIVAIVPREDGVGR
jgi:hypothetical protein